MTAVRTRAASLLTWIAGPISSLLLVSGSAHAFQLPQRFLESAVSGGGGGRLFTGSAIDNYTCKVCHTEGTPPHLKISGLPVNGYIQGQTYPIVLSWPSGLASVALNLEFTNRAGMPFGRIAAPSSTQITPADLCANGNPNVTAQPRPDQRQFALVGECGSHQATILWTAPPALTDPLSAQIGTDVVFTGSLVSSDKDGTVNGDSVTDFSRIISLSGQSQPVTSKVSGGCNAARGQMPPSPWTALYAFAAAMLVARRRRID